MSGCCRSAMPRSSAAPPTSPRIPSRSGACRRARHPRRRRRGGGARRGVRLARDPPPGHLFRDDHAGAGADGRISSRCRRRSPAARTASRRCRAAHLFGLIDLNDTLTMYYFVLAVFLIGFAIISAHHPLAVRPGPEGDPRERAARDLARLQHRPLQAPGLHPVGRARRPGRLDSSRWCSSSPR